MIQQINQQASITRLRDTFRFLHSVSNAISSSQSCRCVVGSCCHSSSSNSRTWGQPLSSSCRVQSVSSSSSSNIHTDASAAIGEANQLEPALYVVGTPIGNLEDMSFRAIRILQGVGLILAEDTRHTRKLLEHFSIRTPTLSCHEHNERQRQELVLQRLQQGEAIALVSDAGMPAISDPGSVMVAAAVAAGIRVVPVPGPCAAIAALAAAGLPTDAFYFAGFLPPKTGRRKAALQELQQLSATLVFYAPPHGLSAILQDVCDVFGRHRQAVVARELTKLHEELFRGTVQELLDEFGPEGRRAVKGEVVLLVSGCSATEQQQLVLQHAAAATTDASLSSATTASSSSDEMLLQIIRRELQSSRSVSATAKALSQRLKMPRSKIYKLALELAQQEPLPAQQASGDGL